MDVHIDNPITKLSLYYSKLIYAFMKKPHKLAHARAHSPLSRSKLQQKRALYGHYPYSHKAMLTCRTPTWSAPLFEVIMLLRETCLQTVGSLHFVKYTHFRQCSIANCLQLIDSTSASMKVCCTIMIPHVLTEHDICTLPRTLVALIRGVFSRAEHPRKDIPRRYSAEFMTWGK